MLSVMQRGGKILFGKLLKHNFMEWVWGADGDNRDDSKVGILCMDSCIQTKRRGHENGAKRSNEFLVYDQLNF